MKHTPHSETDELPLPKNWRTAWTRDLALVRSIARMALIDIRTTMVGVRENSPAILEEVEAMRTLLYGKDKPLISPIVDFSSLMLKYHMFDLEWNRAREEAGEEAAETPHYAPLTDQQMRLLERYLERRRGESNDD